MNIMTSNNPAVSTAGSAVIERVKKLLALSTSDNPNERDQALAKANALIAEHQIDLVLLEGDDSKPEAFDEVECVHGARLPVEVKFIGWLLAEHFRVKVVNSNKRVREARWVGEKYFSSEWGKVRKYIGRKSDAEFARWLHGYLLEEFRRRWVYFKNAHGAPAGERNTFIYGMYKGLDSRLKEERKQTETTYIQRIAEQQARDAVTYDGGSVQEVGVLQAAGKLQEKFQLAVASEEKSLDSELSRRYPRLTSGRASRLTIRHGSSSLEAGTASGRNISLSRPLNA